MHLSGLDLFYWAYGLIAHIVLLGVLLFRQRAKRFPVFTTLIAFNIVRTLVLYYTHWHASAPTYFKTYWTIGVFDFVLQMGVVYELASGVFRPMGVWDREVRQGFMLIGAASLLIAAGLTTMAKPPADYLPMELAIRGQFFSSALMGELFVGMTVLSVKWGFPWRTHVARITQGFGIYAIFGILTEGAHSYFGLKQGTELYALVSRIRISLYALCVTYWIAVLVKDEPKARQLPEQLRLELRELQRRTAMLLQSLRGMGRQ